MYIYIGIMLPMFYARDLLATDVWKAVYRQPVKGPCHTLVWSLMAGHVLQRTSSGPKSLGYANNSLFSTGYHEAVTITMPT